ncbi:MAG: efflux RND transporter periplasmic adaptor subunit [Bryobacteraceae bacterium]
MTRKSKLEIALAVGVIAAVGGLTLLRGSSRPQYKTEPVTRGDIESTIAATGNCNAVVTVQVGSQVSGNVKTLYADFNTQVKKGQLVALIDPEIFQARVKQAQANVDSARAAIANAEAVASKVKADIESSKGARGSLAADLEKAHVTVRDAKLKYDRRQEMVRQGIIAREENDTARTTYEAALAAEQAAEAQMRAAEANVKSVEAQYQVSLAQVQSAKAQERQAEASLAQAQLDLEHTRIVAPVDGTVISRRVDAGQTVAASLQAPTMFEIAQDLTRMQVDTNVDEADIGRVRPGQRATFTVDAYPGTVFQASVLQIRQAPINTQNVITYDVVLAVDNSGMKLFPGMTASVRILADTAANVLQVPNAAFRFRPTGTAAGGAQSSRTRPSSRQAVHVLGGDGQPRQVMVATGLSNGSFTEIKDGLNQGDRVIVSDAGSKPATAQPAARGPRGPSF